jgi:hypothetical protein
MSTATVVRDCIRAQIGAVPLPNNAQLGPLRVNTSRLEGCLNTNLPLPPGIPYAHGSIDPNWTVGVLIADATARQAVGGPGGAHLRAVSGAGAGGSFAFFKVGRPPRAVPPVKGAGASKVKAKKPAGNR